MPEAIPEKYLDLFNKRSFASVATLMPDGRPQVTPMWCEYDGKHVIVNSAKGRVKDRNMRREPRISMAVMDPDNPYRYLQVQGRIVEITESGAEDHIEKLSHKYTGKPYAHRQPGEVRVMYKIAPERAQGMG